MLRASAITIAIASSACGIPAYALKPEPQRPRATVDQGVATSYDPRTRICEFELRSGANTRIIALPDHAYTSDQLVAVTPLPPGHYSISAVTSGRYVGPDKANGAIYNYTDCARHRSTRRVRIEFDVTAGAVTLISLPGGAIDLAELDALRPASHVVWRDQAWTTAIANAASARRAELVAARREPRDGYDVYRDCGLMGPTVSVVRTTGNELPLNPNTIVHVPNGFETKARAAIRSAIDGGYINVACVDRHNLFILVARPELFEEAARQAGEWLVQNDLRGEISISVAIGNNHDPDD